MPVLLLEALRCCLSSILVAGRGGWGARTLLTLLILLPLPLPLLVLLLLLPLPSLLPLLSCFMRLASPGCPLLSPSATRLPCCAARRPIACVAANILALFSGLGSKR
jgi:hypothetical protein